MYQKSQNIIFFIFLFFLVLIFQNCSRLKGEKWSVENGVLLSGGETRDKKAKAYWDYICKVLPTELLEKYVTRFKLFSDGEEEEMGGMAALNKFNTQWELDIDTIDFNLQSQDSMHILNFNHTVIHEFAHLLTLNPEQVIITNDKFQNDEKGYLTGEGYARKNSYLGRFVQEFWKKPLLFDWDDIQNIRREEEQLDLLYAFYLDHKDHFVTSYAAESPEEDIAESWVFFVLCDKQKMHQIRNEKIMFFYDFPELVEYRLEIRRQLKFLPIDYLENYVDTRH